MFIALNKRGHETEKKVNINIFISWKYKNWSKNEEEIEKHFVPSCAYVKSKHSEACRTKIGLHYPYCIALCTRTCNFIVIMCVL